MSTDWSANFASAGLDAMTAYDEILVPRLFDPWAEVLLDEVGVVPGASVLDVACGPGTVARRAAGRVGRWAHVTACDLSPDMLAAARGQAPPAGRPPPPSRQAPARA